MTRTLGVAFAALALAAAPATSADNRISTLVGGGALEVEGVAARSAELSSPTAVAPARFARDVAFNHAEGCLVKRLDFDPATPDAAGNVLNAAGNSICGGGLAFTSATPANVPLSGVSGLSRTAAGNFLIADSVNGFVHIWVDGLILTVAGNGDTATACAPGAAVPNNSVPADTPLCVVRDVAAHPTNSNRFLVAEDGTRATGSHVYLVDRMANTLTKVAGGGCPAPDNTPPAEVCLGPPNAGAATSRLAVEWKPDGVGFLVADRERDVVREFSSTDYGTATASVVAGQADTPGGTGDGGAAGSALLNEPADLDVFLDGSLFIADRGNCRVRRVAGTLSTDPISHFAGAAPNGSGVSACGTDTEGDAAGDLGYAETARLGHPEGVSGYDNGILIADTDQDRIRLVERATITSGPPKPSGGNDPAFEFDAVHLAAEITCQLDNGIAFTCGGPSDKEATFTDVPDGQHTLKVSDSAGAPELDPTPAEYTWKVDTTPPADFGLREPPDGATGQPPQPTFSWDVATDATTSVVDYELLVDGANADGDGTCADGACSGSPSAPLAEGVHTWQVRATDSAGNQRTTNARTIAVGTPPEAGLTAAPNPVLVGGTVTFASTSVDANGPIARHEWDLDGDGVFETDTGAEPTAARAYASAGSVPVSLRVTDGVGITAVAATTLQVNNAPIPAGQLGVSVNNGAQYTNDRQVKILLKYPSTTTQVLVSNDGGFLAPQTFTPAAEVDWTLDSSGPERLPKTVYVRFLLGGIVSETFTDDIILDETPPKVTSASVSASAATARAAAARRWTVKVRATDSNSGVRGVQVTSSKRKPGKLLRYKRTLKVRSAQRPRFVRARDRAGNYSRWKKLR